MIGCSPWYYCGVLSCRSWSTVLQCGAKRLIHILRLWTEYSQSESFLTGALLTSNLAHRRFVAMFCWQSKIKSHSMHPVRCIAFALCPQADYSWCFDYLSALVWVPSPHNWSVKRYFCASLSFSVERFRRPCVWWCRISGLQEEGQCYFVGLICSLFLSSTVFSLSSFFGLVVLGLGSSDW